MYTTPRFTEMVLVLLSLPERKTWSTPLRTLITPNSDHMRERHPTSRLSKTTVVERPRDPDPVLLTDPVLDPEDDPIADPPREGDRIAGANPLPNVWRGN